MDVRPTSTKHVTKGGSSHRVREQVAVAVEMTLQVTNEVLLSRGTGSDEGQGL